MSGTGLLYETSNECKKAPSGDGASLMIFGRRVDLCPPDRNEPERHLAYIRNMVNLSRTAPMPGCDIAYSDGGGDRQPVLFLHGAGADHVMFDDQVDALRAVGHRVVTWDMRAHGLSRPNTVAITGPRLLADAETLVDEVGLEQPLLVGHSLGGNIAQALVRRRPGAYAGLVVIDSTWNTGPLSRWERRMLRLAAPALRAIPAVALPGVMARASAVTSRARADLRRAFAQVTKSEFLAVWEATTSFVTPNPSYRTPLPLLLVRGDRDRTGNIARAMHAWAAHDGAREAVIDGAGHVPTLDAPVAVTSALLAFLDSLERLR